ncbi:unnamed protein product [Symbiodinium natans]|uniref:Uncharacterized protein n=1 Tax=Symbiodinium natans TaxID=878477 RepID=A0A812SA32_9DINO|nr:unnamed protein product [Symbiodinium natans]
MGPQEGQAPCWSLNAGLGTRTWKVAAPWSVPAPSVGARATHRQFEVQAARAQQDGAELVPVRREKADHRAIRKSNGGHVNRGPPFIKHSRQSKRFRLTQQEGKMRLLQRAGEVVSFMGIPYFTEDGSK